MKIHIQKNIQVKDKPKISKDDVPDPKPAIEKANTIYNEN